jgi:hypothetical protein
LSVTNTIVSLNEANGTPAYPDYKDTDNISFTGPNCLEDDPSVGVLQDNGGPTWTHALQPGSICLDTGETTLTVDQRNEDRPDGAEDDIGAFEGELDTDDGAGFSAPTSAPDGGPGSGS